MMMHTEEQLNTSPLQFYRRAFWVALVITIMLAATLTLHLYNLKLQQAFTQFETHYARVNSQLDKTVSAIDNILLAVNVSLEQPLSYEFTSQTFSPVEQHANYFYRSLGNQAGELVGYGNLQGVDLSLPYWRKVMALGGVFNTSLALLEPLEAIAYVSENGLVFVQRRHTQNSELLSQIVSGRFRENTDFSRLMTSQRVEIAGKSYFALSNKRISSSGDHTLMIFDAQKFQAIFYDKSVPEAEIYLTDKLNRNLINNVTLEPPSYPKVAELAPWHDGLIFYESVSARPLDVVMKISEQGFAHTIIYSLGLEFSFILLFILATYFPLHWLCEQIFVRPLKELFAFIQNPENTQNNYIVPKLWLSEFKQVKAIHQHRTQLFTRVKDDHQALTDLLQQKQQHLELAGQDKERQSAVLKGVLDAVPDAIYYKNTDGALIGCNRAFERLIKSSKLHLLGKDFNEFATNFEVLSLIEAKVRNQHKPISQQISVENASYFTSVAPFFSEQLGVMGCVGVLRDITEHQQALEQLQVSESNFKSAIEYAPNGVALVKVDGTVMLLNKAAERYLGCQKQQGQHVSMLFGRENYQQIAQVLEHLAKQNQLVDKLSLTQSGTYRFLDLRVSLVSDSTGMPKYFVIHIQDVTEITSARLEAERATLAKSRFIANLSHEIRTPLNVIMGLVDMVKQSVNDKTQQTRLETVTHAAQTLLDMLNDILDFAKVESHEISIKTQDIAVSKLCLNLLELIEPLAKKKGLEVAFKVDENIWPYLLGDKQKLTQIMLNLLNNAVKYTTQGLVSFQLSLIKSDAETQQVRFSVIDTGIGIKESDQTKLFDAFTQVDDSLSREHEGIGLGLAIVKHEVELLGGSIQLHSELGKGSEFYFSLTLNKKPLTGGTDNHDCVYFAKSLPHIAQELGIMLADDVDGIPCKTRHLIIGPDTSPNVLEALLTHVSQYNIEQIYLCNDAPLNDESADVLTRCEKGAYLQICLEKIFGTDNTLKTAAITAEKTQDDLHINHLDCSHYQGALCLVVDDNDVNLEITKNMLQKLEVHVITRQTAKDICDVVDKLAPDIIFMDIHMPEVDGFQAAKQISKQSALKHIPIFALTANTEIASQQEYLHSSMHGYINKPVTIEELESVLVKHVRIKRKFFDESFALQQLMNEPLFLDNMLIKFSELCDKYLQQLEHELTIDELILLAHSAKGASAGLGFEQLAEAAKQLELNLKQHSQIKNPELIAQLRASLMQAKSFLEQRKSGC